MSHHALIGEDAVLEILKLRSDQSCSEASDISDGAVLIIRVQYIKLLISVLYSCSRRVCRFEVGREC